MHPSFSASFLQSTMAAMLDIYQELLSLKFIKDEELSKTAWAPGVNAYQVGCLMFARCLSVRQLCCTNPACVLCQSTLRVWHYLGCELYEKSSNPPKMRSCERWLGRPG